MLRMNDAKGFLGKKFMRSSSTTQMAFSYLTKMKDVEDPSIWEKFTLGVLPLLDELEPTCRKMTSDLKLQPEVQNAASHWLRQICDVRDRASRVSQTIIGVFGNTGDGKSSAINALLDEVDLFPTNCHRACTATAIEVSYNHNDDEQKSYRAEIEFISVEDWLREVDILLSSLIENGTISPEHTDPESAAAQALAKIRAVYPSLGLDNLAASTAHQLAGHPDLCKVLGTTKHLKASSAYEIRDLVESFIDSHDKDDKSMAYWPLTKVVRIFTKAEVLANGVTIVDLPGHQDGDAARASVATEYMKSCTGIWVVAPMNRAADNKTAKDIISDRIKRQLKLDGALEALAVICSKTDEIEVQTAVRSLRKSLGEQTMKAWNIALSCDRRIRALEQDVVRLRRESERVRMPVSDTESERPAKRARTGARAATHDIPEPLSTAASETSDDVHVAKLDAKCRELDSVKSRKQQHWDMVHAMCIHKRIEITRKAIQQHLTKNFEELDRLDSHDDQNTSRTRVDRESHDYEEMSCRTPVFCISSHAYLKLQGLMMGEHQGAPGYGFKEETGIPQLQQYAQKLTEKLRIGKQKEVLSGLCEVLNSIGIWAQDVPINCKAMNAGELKALVCAFEKDLLAEVQECADRLANTIQHGVLDKLSHAAGIAASEAENTVSRWAAPLRQGGIHVGTLKAALQRYGVWKTHDFNEELIAPVKENVADDWVRFFQVDLPIYLDRLVVGASRRLELFHNDIMEKLGGDEDPEEAQFSEQLQQQVNNHQDQFSQIAYRSLINVNKAQKEASRTLAPTIEEMMIPVYQECLGITGKGTTRMIQYIITKYVKDNKDVIFLGVVGKVNDILWAAMNRAEKDLICKVKIIGSTMRHDYTLALTERENSGRLVEAAFKESMTGVLEEAEICFK
ncbi:Nuclear GTPase SLIP-GC 2 [Colletotrichum chlorophyti]|uniref:Nuclear GTPase SLIP-GC 2 n=1 Tax=Colletotrichum chlorophyti TaxID=708187 RepID=A0A1Q8RG83_9PEZI|nr:Nuclear GTPase SLIP-GC 2 [Colletotrichum chlorophyti]